MLEARRGLQWMDKYSSRQSVSIPVLLIALGTKADIKMPHAFRKFFDFANLVSAHFR